MLTMSFFSLQMTKNADRQQRSRVGGLEDSYFQYLAIVNKFHTETKTNSELHQLIIKLCESRPGLLETHQ